jgi:hypothetical protein
MMMVFKVCIKNSDNGLHGGSIPPIAFLAIENKKYMEELTI